MNPSRLYERNIAKMLWQNRSRRPDLKPNRQIILMSQGTSAELHFDLRNNNMLADAVSLLRARALCSRPEQKALLHELTPRQLSLDLFEN